MDGLKRIIQLIVDPKSLRDLEKDSREALDKGTDPKTPKRNLSAVESAMDRVKKAAVALGAAILGAFSIKAIAGFARSAIDASFELESSRLRLAQALRNEGIELANVNGELQQFTRNLWETHRLTEGEVNPVLQQLITITGDYELSLRGVGIAADLAAAANMDVTSAARLVGRVMRGETTALRRYGIVIEDGADAVAVLEDKLKGMALAATPATQELSKAFGDLKEEIGFALREATGFDDRVTQLTGRIVALKDNTELIGRTMRELVRAMRDLVTVVGVLLGVKGLAGLRLAFVATRTAAIAAGGGVQFLLARIQALLVTLGPVGIATAVLSYFIILLNRTRDAAQEAAIAIKEAFEELISSSDLAAMRAEQVRLVTQIAILQKELEELSGPLGDAFVPTTKRARELNEQINELTERYNRLGQAMRGATEEPTPATGAGEVGQPGEAPRGISGMPAMALMVTDWERLDREKHERFLGTLTVISTAAADAQAAAYAEQEQALRAHAQEMAQIVG
jgi:K+/H+ antiporter YhaU regulatory subunit KhtT/regulator of replication initiation timing